MEVAGETRRPRPLARAVAAGSSHVCSSISLLAPKGLHRARWRPSQYLVIFYSIYSISWQHCLVIEIRHNPINKQTQLQLVTQFRSQGRDPVLDHPREHLGCVPSCPASPAKGYLGLPSALAPKPSWYLRTIDHLPIPRLLPNTPRSGSRVIEMLSGSTELLFHNQTPNVT